ncbi:MAG: hypothetical protein ABIN97_17730 [Ginsengibacter sp.]
MKLIITIISLIFFLACQKEFNAPVVKVIVPGTVQYVSSLVITGSFSANYYSIVYNQPNL